MIRHPEDPWYAEEKPQMDWVYVKMCLALTSPLWGLAVLLIIAALIDDLAKCHG